MFCIEEICLLLMKKASFTAQIMENLGQLCFSSGDDVYVIILDIVICTVMWSNVPGTFAIGILICFRCLDWETVIMFPTSIGSHQAIYQEFAKYCFQFGPIT